MLGGIGQKTKMLRCGPCPQEAYNQKGQIRHVHRKIQPKVDCDKCYNRTPAQVPELSRG